MIRLVQRKLIIPRGDTGSFSIPIIAAASQSDVAVFTIFDCLTRAKVFQKIVAPRDSNLVIEFTHNDTVNLPPGRYVWDIKFYKNPQYADDELVNGDEIDSYYAGYSLPDCEIRETGDNLLVSPDAAQGTLSPEQLDIISAAIATLNDAIDKTADNVAHYPQIRDEEWYVWSAEANDYVATGVSANGIVGNGIESAVVNNDYTLTLNFTDGTSYTSGSIRGETGNGIEDVVLNNDYTLTIAFTDGTSYTTPSIRGMIGATPQFSIGTVQEGASAAATITGTAEAPVLNLTLPNANVPTKVSELENDANYAVDVNYVHTDNNYTTEEKTKLSGIAAGAEVNVNADWNATEGDAFIRNKPTSVSSFTNDVGYLTAETDPTVPAWAKAAQKPTYTAAEVGAPTIAEMQQAIANVNTMKIHICAQGEYDSETGVPTVQNPDAQTFYLVPGGEGSNLFIEWVYVNNAWEQFGSASIDLSGYATKEEVPVESGTDAGSVKTKDFTYNDITYSNTASGAGAFAEGANTTAKGQNSHAEGSNTYVRGSVSHVEGSDVYIRGNMSHAEGLKTVAYGHLSHVEGNGVGTKTIVISPTNIAKTYTIITNSNPVLTVNQIIFIASNGAFAKVNSIDGNTFVTDFTLGEIENNTTAIVFISGTAHPQSHIEGVATMTSGTSQHVQGKYNAHDIPNASDYADIVGNGTADNARSNAFALTWTGDGKYAGDIYVHANADSSGGTKVATVDDIAAIEVPVNDVQVNNVSVVDANGVANVPVAAFNTLGVIGISQYGGLEISSNGYLSNRRADSYEVKQGSSQLMSITPVLEHAAAFYGLAKASGDTTQSQSANAVGQYTNEAKSSIQSMLGVSDLLAPRETSYIASQAYAVGDIFTLNGKLYKVTTAIAESGAIVVQDDGETVSGANAVQCKLGEERVKDVQVNGTSVISNGVANIPKARTNNYTAAGAGVIWAHSTDYGVRITADGQLEIYEATDAQIKSGNKYYNPITAKRQHMAVFYGLAKAAGDTTQSASSNAVGNYTEDAKSKISEMLNGSVPVTGTTPTITALSGIQYVCGEVSTLDITLPASGIVDVVFTSGSTPTVLTITPPTGVTMKWANGFDPTSLKADTTYELNIKDGLGVAVGWT